MPTETQQDFPAVAVIVPAISATGNLTAAIRSIVAQDYRGSVDLVVADGSGGSALACAVRGVAPHARVVANPTGTTPDGLNAALRSTSAPIITRCDAHSVLSPTYLRTAVATLRRTGAANVGGQQVSLGTTCFTRAIALAHATWLGNGGARYRQGGSEGPVDTVYLGTFRRDALEKVGGFNTRCRINEDYELNYRLRQQGEVIWFEPALEVSYRPRSNLWDLVRQYFSYGMGKWTMLQLYPRSTRLRQVVPPLLVLGLTVSVALAVIGAARAALVVPVAWLGALVGCAVAVGVRRGTWSALVLPLVLAIMHLSWGIGLLARAVRTVLLRRRGESADLETAR